MDRLAVALAASVAVIAGAAAAGAWPRAVTPTLTAIVGPGFTIRMSAKRVEAGTYVVTVKDLSAFHNFHLTGPGVNKWTSVAKQGTTTWKLRLRDGTYRFVCDPHATSMKGKLEVVS